MARARDILIRFIGDDKGLQASTKATGSALDRLKKGFDNLAGAAKAFIGLQLAKTLISWAEAAAEDAKAQEILAQSLRTNVGATENQIAANEKWIDSMQLATLVADNDLRQAVTNLTVAGRTLAEAQGDVAIAIDISKSRGIELTAVIGAMTRSLATGATTGFGRLGIATKNAAGEALSYEEILQAASETMGGSAAAAANTLSGRLERQKILWAELQEDIGADVLPVLVGAAEGITEINETFADDDGVLRWRSAIFEGIPVLEDWARTSDDATAALRATTEAATANMNELELRRGVIQGAVADADALAASTAAVTAAMKEQREELRAMTDPVFASARAEEKLVDAHDKYTRAVIESGEGSSEATSALTDLFAAQRDVEFANADMVAAAEGSETAFQRWATAIGLSNEALRTWIDLQRIAAGMPALTLPGLPSADGDRRTIDDVNRALTRFGRETVS